MIVITPESSALQAPEEWNEQYKEKDFWGQDKYEIGRRLSALAPEERTPEVIAEIIGNTTWAQSTACDECGLYCDVVVSFENFSGYAFMLCKDCLKNALAEVNKEKEKVK